LIDLVVIRLLGNVKGKDLLDLGCGNRYLSRCLSRAGAKVMPIDPNPSIISLAKNRGVGNTLNIDYKILDASALSGLQDNSFDIVLSNMVLMDVENTEGAIQEVSRVLRRKGRIIASISHPCFDNGKNSAWIIEKVAMTEAIVSRKITKYRTPFAEEIDWQISPCVRKKTMSFHRPLSWYGRVLRSTGLATTSLEEPEPTGEFISKEPEGPWFRVVPFAPCV
jgi:ubiquinone/menaquinone biosynthesis C-methylase UbiE